MNVICFDDEKFSLLLLKKCVEDNVSEGTSIQTFERSDEVLNYANSHTIDVAFLDINSGINEFDGIKLATKLQEKNPRINIIFVTGYNANSIKAWKMHVSGFVEKPVTPDAIKYELEHLRIPVSDFLMKVYCSNRQVDIYDKNSKLIPFSRQKCKEILCYLLYMDGINCSIEQIADIVLKDDKSVNKIAYVYKLLSVLKSELKKYEASEVLVSTLKNISINRKKIEFVFLNKTDSVDSLKQRLMELYKWEE